jgi:hypothetical protein
VASALVLIVFGFSALASTQTQTLDRTIRRLCLLTRPAQGRLAEFEAQLELLTPILLALPRGDSKGRFRNLDEIGITALPAEPIDTTQWSHRQSSRLWPPSAVRSELTGCAPEPASGTGSSRQSVADLQLTAAGLQVRSNTTVFDIVVGRNGCICN